MKSIFIQSRVENKYIWSTKMKTKRFGLPPFFFLLLYEDIWWTVGDCVCESFCRPLGGADGTCGAGPGIELRSSGLSSRALCPLSCLSPALVSLFFFCMSYVVVSVQTIRSISVEIRKITSTNCKVTSLSFYLFLHRYLGRKLLCHLYFPGSQSADCL